VNDKLRASALKPFALSLSKGIV